MSFTPENELEAQMEKAQSGELDLEVFLNKLVDSPVFMPVHIETNTVDGEETVKQTPMSMQDDNGLNFLVIFTSSDRASNFIKQFPEYQDGIVETLRTLLLMNGIGYGVAINPGEEVGIDLGPEMVEEIVMVSK